MVVTFGVDVARMGADKTVLAVREDQAITHIHRWGKADTMTTTGRIIDACRLYHPSRIVIDVSGGVGAGPFDRLREQNYPVVAFNAAQRSTGRDRSGQMSFLNRRAEAFWRFREMLDPTNGGGISLPDDALLKGDLTAIHWKTNSGGRVQIESKDEIRARLRRSPDTADAVVMAFWEAGGDDWFRAELERMDTCPRCGAAEFVLHDDRLWRCLECHFVALEDGVTPARGNAIF